MRNDLYPGILLMLVLLPFLTIAQVPAGDYQSGMQRDGNTLRFPLDSSVVELSFCSASMVRVRTSWNGRFEADEPWMVVTYDWPVVDVQVSEATNQFILQTTRLKVVIHKAPFTIDFFSSDGQLLSSESGGGARMKGDKVACYKHLEPDEHFFGFGERMDFVDQRNKQLTLNVGRGTGRPHIIGAYNVLEANYCPVPFMLSTRGYGIFLHNPYATEWDLGLEDNTLLSFGAKHGELDYYFIYGPRFTSILDHYTDLTGKAPLMPKFALGLHVGTYSGGTWGHEEHTSASYVIDLVRRFRELGIPLDILHLDSTWRIFGKNGGKGATTFEWRETFKDPEAMFDSLYAMHINLAGVHIRPRFDNGNKLDLLDQARALGHTYPEADNPGEFVNFFDQDAVDWWWDNGVMQVASIGARFVKTDEGSAFSFKANESDKVGPSGLEATRLHNLFPLAYAKAPFEKFMAFNEMRGMNHTREGYAGIQRYPFIFAGDWPSEWQYFAPVIKAGLNIGLSGIGNWTHCMGGFEHEADPELYIRWCQFGLMSPVAHLFGMDHPGYKEPWNYGEEALDNFRKYTRLRYRLIPYLYSHSHEMYRTGIPLMRALVLSYQDDPNVYTIGDQYLLGNNLMICPVTVKGAQTREVYLPEGTWFDYWSGKRYEGKKYVQIVTPLEQLPIFAKGGAIVPMQDVVNYIGERPLEHMTLDIWPQGNSSFVLYDDDGKSLQYQNDWFATTHITCEDSGGGTSIVINMPVGKFRVPERFYSVRVHRTTAPGLVNINGMAMDLKEDVQNGDFRDNPGWTYDAEVQKLYIHTGQSSRNRIQIDID